MTPARARRILALVRLRCFLAYPREIANFRRKLGYWPDPALPRRRNELYLWRRIFDRNPLFTALSDKLAAKRFALDRHPGLRVARTLWEGERAEDIPEALLAGNVAVKANHGSGWNFFIEGGRYDRADLLARTRKWMSRTYGRRHSQWGYFGIAPRLFVEELLLDERGERLVADYKVYAGGGTVAFVFVRQRAADGSLIEGVVDEAGRVYPERYDSGVLSAAIEVPPELGTMCAIARDFSRLVDFLRCDFYLAGGAIYFSEFTFYPAAGYAWIDHDGLNRRYTGAWDLRRSWFLATSQRGWRGRYAEALRSILDGAAGTPPRQGRPSAV
ncbi:MAG: hypothetical protein IT535_03715 [Bauldia sp.]|nr:hypothetical protein [Bauldia sp.]